MLHVSSHFDPVAVDDDGESFFSADSFPFAHSREKPAQTPSAPVRKSKPFHDSSGTLLTEIESPYYTSSSVGSIAHPQRHRLNQMEVMAFRLSERSGSFEELTQFGEKNADDGGDDNDNNSDDDDETFLTFTTVETLDTQQQSGTEDDGYSLTSASLVANNRALSPVREFSEKKKKKKLKKKKKKKQELEQRSAIEPPLRSSAVPLVPQHENIEEEFINFLLASKYLREYKKKLKPWPSVDEAPPAVAKSTRREAESRKNEGILHQFQAQPTTSIAKQKITQPRRHKDASPRHQPVLPSNDFLQSDDSSVLLFGREQSLNNDSSMAKSKPPPVPPSKPTLHGLFEWNKNSGHRDSCTSVTSSSSSTIQTTSTVERRLMASCGSLKKSSSAADLSVQYNSTPPWPAHKRNASLHALFYQQNTNLIFPMSGLQKTVTVKPIITGKDLLDVMEPVPVRKKVDFHTTSQQHLNYCAVLDETATADPSTSTSFHA